MEKQYVISIDIGTSSCKTALFDETGSILAMASQEHQTKFKATDAVEQDPHEWWRGVIATVHQVMEETKINKNKIAVIGVDSQSSSMIPVSREGKVLHPAMIWTDRRSGAEKQWLDREVGQELFTQINGNHNDESNVAPKILWFKNTYPSLYQETHQILNATGYIVYRLTGIFSCNLTEGGLTQLFHMEQRVWSEELCRACSIDSEKLPPLYPCYEVVGQVEKEVAEAMGILPGIPVVAGSMDAVACGLGCGIVKKGDAFITGGTVTAVGVCTDKPIYNEDFHVYPYIVPDTWCNVAGVDFGGGNYRWFRDEFMSEWDKATVYPKMNEMAESAGPGADKLLFLPTSVGQRCPQWDGSMRGVYFGITPKHGKSHFLRAIMEGNAFAVREIVACMEREGGQVKKLMIAGGIAKSRIWMEIFADVLAKPLYLSLCEEATVMGNMMNAAYGVGMLKSFDQAADYCQFQSVDCSQKNHAAYNRLYKVYQSLYPALRESFQELSGIEL